jgi:NAD-dependent protein deacetylase/lipoamidase
MSGPAVCDRLSVALDHVLVAKPRSANVDAARVDLEPIVEPGRLEMTHVRLDRHRLYALLSQRGIATPKSPEVLDPRDFEPDEILGVVRDPLRVGLGEANLDLGVEVESVDEETLRRLAQLVRERGPAIVLTGAGISTESGIPDFRSPSGIWARYDPQEYATIDAFRGDPVKVWSFYARRFRALTDARPNAGHLALVELEQAGWVRAIVTQNIDLLHERAGSQEVVEVHGSIRTSSCRRCSTRYGVDEVLRLLDETDAPRCTACNEVLKPDVVFFGELLPEAAIDRAYELARSAGLLLVVGSGLEVWPVSMLPDEAARSGGQVAIVNLGPTTFDDQAVLKIEGSAGETLAALVSKLGT